MEEELVEKEPSLSREDVARAIDARVEEDLDELRGAIRKCRRCPGGGRGIPGCGEPVSTAYLATPRKRLFRRVPFCQRLNEWNACLADIRVLW